MTPHRPTKQERALKSAMRRYRRSDALASQFECDARVARTTANLILAELLGMIEPAAAKALKGRA